MSDQKKVIHVKDLVIKADNVHIEPQRRPYRDPFFGPRRPLTNEESSEAENSEKEESDDDKDERRPFSWI